MGRKKKDEPAGDGAAAEPAKGKSNMVPAIVVAVGLVIGGFLMGRGGGDQTSAASAAAEHEPTTTTIAVGAIVKLDSVTLNLADGRFLKVGMALQLSKSAQADTFQAEGLSAKALDIAIKSLGRRTYSELQVPKTREEAKEQLSEAVARAYKDEVLDVYFTEFVMQ